MEFYGEPHKLGNTMISINNFGPKAAALATPYFAYRAGNAVLRLGSISIITSLALKALFVYDLYTAFNNAQKVYYRYTSFKEPEQFWKEQKQNFLKSQDRNHKNKIIDKVETVINSTEGFANVPLKDVINTGKNLVSNIIQPNVTFTKASSYNLSDFFKLLRLTHESKEKIRLTFYLAKKITADTFILKNVLFSRAFDQYRGKKVIR